MGSSLYESDEPANLSAHVALCRMREGNEPLFLKYYLASRLGQASISKAKVGSTYPHINVRRLKELPLVIPPLDIQRQLVADMDAARAERSARLAQADALLAGMDGYVLDALGLQPPAQAEQLAFAVWLGDIVSNNRMNVDYFHPERTGAIQTMQSGLQLRSVPMTDSADFIRTLFQSNHRIRILV